MILKKEREKERKKKKVNNVLSTQHRLCSAAHFPTSCCLLTSSLFSFEAFVFAVVSLRRFSEKPSEGPG